MKTGVLPPVFDVDLVVAVEKETSSEVLKILPKQVPPASRERAAVDELPPETVFGERAESGVPEQDMEEQTGRRSFSDNESILPPGKDGFALNPKSFLFDRKTIEKYASKKNEDETNLKFDVSEFQHRGYMRMLKNKIEGIWKYPNEAARLRIAGDLYIRFSIKRDGSLGEIELLRTSGYKDLDAAALRALKNAEPYWPLPDSYKETELSITGHFIYIIGRVYVM